VLDGLGVPTEDVVAYLCGNPDMILAAEAVLLDAGLAPEQVRKELYWPKGKGPAGR
jgi:hypothetical protein